MHVWTEKKKAGKIANLKDMIELLTTDATFLSE